MKIDLTLLIESYYSMGIAQPGYGSLSALTPGPSPEAMGEGELLPFGFLYSNTWRHVRSSLKLHRREIILYQSHPLSRSFGRGGRGVRALE